MGTKVTLGSATPKTLALRVSYNGAPFCGFARQPGQSTVQGELEHALELVFHREVPTVCAGRTDAGVHARGQVVSFEVSEDEWAACEPAPLLRSLNALTAEGISVRAAWRAPDGFSARFDAVAREYRYFFCVSDQSPVFMTDFSWHTGPLSIEAMQDAARPLIGEHDFKSFCKAVSAVDKPTCRELLEITFEREELFGEQLVVMRVVGSSFLHSMVRTMAGTLVAVGKGKRSVPWVADVLTACDRQAAGECAPAQGLVFWDVRYE